MQAWGGYQITGYDATFDSLMEQQDVERAQRESLETAFRHHEVPRTPGWAYADEGDAGASSSHPPPPETQTQPDWTDDHDSRLVRPVPRRPRSTEVTGDPTPDGRPLQRARRAPDRYSDSRYDRH